MADRLGVGGGHRDLLGGCYPSDERWWREVRGFHPGKMRTAAEEALHLHCFLVDGTWGVRERERRVQNDPSMIIYQNVYLFIL